MQVYLQHAWDQRLERDAIAGLADAIAHELWRLYSRGGRMNWEGAERHLCRIVDQARGDAHQARVDLALVAADSTSAFHVAGCASGDRDACGRGDEQGGYQ